MKKKLRIFISSPSDVNLERGIAKRVIAELGEIYRDYVQLETIMWEDLPLEATNSFQGGIDYFLKEAPVDIAVFILWSRLGSTLGHTFRRGDGSVYSSGTEYEFDTMYSLRQQTGGPKLLVYVKESEMQFASGMSTGAIKDALKQQEMLNEFIQERFHDADTNTNYAYWQFDKQQTFEERLKTHLMKLIVDGIGADVDVREWVGNPYVGLKSFGFEESSIYCGRKDLVYKVAQQLMSVSQEQIRQPLLVLGESGSGKSSFVRAGILSHLVNYGSSVTREHVNEILPSVYHTNIYSGIVEILTNEFPFLNGNPVLDELRKGISDNYNFRHLKYALESRCNQLCTVFFIDQFEEIFSNSQIPEQERERTFLLLMGLCDVGCIQMIFSMRSDFYNIFTRYPNLCYIKNNAIVVDLPKVSYEDITEIIESPAKKANLKWEINDRGVKLSKQIAQDAFALGQLPLIEFGLSELYNACLGGEQLTFRAYAEIGKLSGAVLKYADKVYNSFSQQEKDAFSDMLSAVITVSDKDKIFVRKTSLVKDIAASEVHKAVLQQLVNAHLFVSGKDSSGEATVTIVHEMLISSWTVVREWCRVKEKFLKQNDYYQKQAGYWAADNKQNKGLVQERSLLLEAEYFLFRYEKVIDPLTYEFLTRSLKRNRRKGLVKQCFILLLLFFLFISSLACVAGIIPLDESFAELMESMSVQDVMLVYGLLLLLSGRALWLRLAANPNYKTIGTTSAIWGAVVAVLFIDTIIEILSGVADWYGLVFPAIFLVAGSSVWTEFSRRKLWKKGVFKPYLVSDRFAVVRNIVLYSISAVFLFVLVAIYGAVVTEKNESLKNTISIADDLFSGLNNISQQLNSEDNIYINSRRLSYISDRFNEEITDTIPDDREFEYATCLYNLHSYAASKSYLYPINGDSKHTLLYILNCARTGEMEEAEMYLEIYVEGEYYDDLTWISSAKLIWVAEKCGRFDLAEKLYEILEDNGVEWRVMDASFWVNYGHIYLSNGDYANAYASYDMALDIFKSFNPAVKEIALIKQIDYSITQDLELFTWHKIIAEDILNRVCRERNYQRREFYTDVADTVATRNFKNLVAGQWVSTDSTLFMTYDADLPICQYRVLNSEFNDINRYSTCYRTSQRGNITYLEEFCEQTNNISQEEVVLISDNRLELKIIENGKPEDKGKVRVFTRHIDEDEE